MTGLVCAGQKNKSLKLQTEAEEWEAEEGMKGGEACKYSGEVTHVSG